MTRLLPRVIPGAALAVALTVAASACSPADDAGAAPPSTRADPTLVRELRLPHLLMGGFGGPAWEEGIPDVEREFWLYADAEGGEPIRRLPETNTLAGRAGPCFFLASTAPDGETFFDEPVWLEVRATPAGTDEPLVMTPRVRLDPDAPLLGVREHRKLSAGDVRVFVPNLPLPTCAMLTDYPAGAMEGPAYTLMMTELMMGGDVELTDTERAAVLAELGVGAPPDPRPFDAGRWAEVDTSDRWDMVQDLLNTHEFLGMTRDEVLELLGEPSPPGFPLGARGWDLVYRVGSTFMDSWWLFLGLDDAGHVSRIRLYED